MDTIISKNGRIIGVKIENAQIWNVYPKSGTAFKQARELFFREELCVLMVNWKDHTRYIFQSGDHNCTHRLSDSLNNGNQHLQPGLVKHMQIHGLSDDFVNVHGDVRMFSRITASSSTRIDFILSNSNACIYFQYVDMNAGLDHKVVLARYEISISLSREFFPQDRLFQGWVIHKMLENDEDFLNQAKYIFEKVGEEMENTGRERDPSFYWIKVKSAITNLAKVRQKELIQEENSRLEMLNSFYFLILEDIFEGKDCLDELEDVKNQLDLIYQDRSKRKIDKMRCIEIDDQTYDIHKLQNQKKFENQSRLKEIKIDDITYKGTPNVVKAIEEKMRDELKSFGQADFNAPPSEMEEHFLSKLKKVSLNENEMDELLAPTNEEEIGNILENEVDPDSSPGADGITYRFLKCFWKWAAFRKVYLNFLNYTRKNGSSGLAENCGVMTVKNKKVQSIEYTKKRKLTKLNKDTNLGNGKVWVNRLKKIILPKILPRNQFNCQSTVNIIDEIREIRSVNSFLLGDGSSEQQNGSIISIDFKDAFRSVSLRWFNLVIQRLGIPQEFIDWFWSMYNELFIVIVINKYKSGKIRNERGFLEGHPPSMAAFCISMIPLMVSLEEVMSGIVTPDGRNHKIKLFADDIKCFIKDLEEIDPIYKVISNFESISGLMMHRDPKQDKCKSLPFGNHRQFQDWPEWVTVKSKIKVIGALFSNSESIDKLNSDLVSQAFHNALQKSYGIRGTIFQKVYFVNTYLFSKIWYIAQCFKLENKMLCTILSKALSFIFAGENERPVRVVNFRPKEWGGLGLIHPTIKAKALLIRNTYLDFMAQKCSINDPYVARNLYGYSEEFVRIYTEGLVLAPVKEIYNFLLKDVLYRNGSIIPSRNEKKSENIKWSVVFTNMSNIKGLTPDEKSFAWKISQDLLPVGARLHRKNADRKCLVNLGNDRICQELQTLEHFFVKCERVKSMGQSLIFILESLLDRNVGIHDLMHFSFNHRSKKKLKVALWFAIKVMFKMFQDRNFNKAQILSCVIKSIDWNLSVNRNLGSLCDIMYLRTLIREEIG